MRRWGWIGWMIFSGLGVLGAGEEVFDPESLEGGEVTLRLQSGRVVTGELIGVDDHQVSLRIQQDAGEVSMGFSGSRIDSIAFRGNEWFEVAETARSEGDWDKAMRIYDGLYLQRTSFFRFLPEREAVAFLPLVETSLQAGDPARAIARAQRLAGILSDPDVLRRLEDLELLGYYRIGLLLRADVLAQSWVQERERFSDSALGWYILAKLSFRDEDPESALWYALHPVVYADRSPTEWLNECLSLAIASAQLIGDYAQRDHLIGDLRRWDLPWVELPEIRLHPGLEDWPRPVSRTENGIPSVETPLEDLQQLPDRREEEAEWGDPRGPLPEDWLPSLLDQP